MWPSEQRSINIESIVFRSSYKRIGKPQLIELLNSLKSSLLDSDLPFDYGFVNLTFDNLIAKANSLVDPIQQQDLTDIAGSLKNYQRRVAKSMNPALTEMVDRSVNNVIKVLAPRLLDSSKVVLSERKTHSQQKPSRQQRLSQPDGRITRSQSRARKRPHTPKYLRQPQSPTSQSQKRNSPSITSGVGEENDSKSEISEIETIIRAAKVLRKIETEDSQIQSANTILLAANELLRLARK